VKQSPKERKRAGESQISEYKSETRPQNGVSKAHLRYWEEAVFQRRVGGNWWVQIQYQGRREKITLGTPIKNAAAERARSLYQTLLVKGWDAALAGLRPQTKAQSTDTVGDLLAELKAKADLKPKTLEDYSKAFRKIVSDVFQLGNGKEKCDYRAGGYQAWLGAVHAVKLRDLTPERIQVWKRTFLSKAGDDPTKQRAAKTSVNSFIRRAKALFAPDALKHLSGVQLPTPLPFAGIKFEPRQSTLYRSTFNAEELIQAAHKELAEDDPAAFLVILLGLCAGLRKGEIDLLPWSAVKFDEGVIRIEPTEYFDVKTEHSIGDIPVDREILPILRGFKARAKSPFVVPSKRAPQVQGTYTYYRCEPVFDRLLLWLKAHGVRQRNALHALRKEYGSIINENFNLMTAKELLRHSSVGITAAHYVENRKRATTGLGAVLTGKIVELPKAKEA
jgi:integrase